MGRGVQERKGSSSDESSSEEEVGDEDGVRERGRGRGRGRGIRGGRGRRARGQIVRIPTDILSHRPVNRRKRKPVGSVEVSVVQLS